MKQNIKPYIQYYQVSRIVAIACSLFSLVGFAEVNKEELLARPAWSPTISRDTVILTATGGEEMNIINQLFCEASFHKDYLLSEKIELAPPIRDSIFDEKQPYKDVGERVTYYAQTIRTFKIPSFTMLNCTEFKSGNVVTVTREQFQSEYVNFDKKYSCPDRDNPKNTRFEDQEAKDAYYHMVGSQAVYASKKTVSYTCNKVHVKITNVTPPVRAIGTSSIFQQDDIFYAGKVEVFDFNALGKIDLELTDSPFTQSIDNLTDSDTTGTIMAQASGPYQIHLNAPATLGQSLVSSLKFWEATPKTEILSKHEMILLSYKQGDTVRTQNDYDKVYGRTWELPVTPAESTSKK